uniref:Uncharacterized protein n=1 Tax=Globodera pallida TaxID=36090 RepID=A0A183BK97_GLOPA
MPDNTSEEEQQQQTKEIFICADIWLEVFALVSPLELGQKMALTSERTGTSATGWLTQRQAQVSRRSKKENEENVCYDPPDFEVKKSTQ